MNLNNLKKLKLKKKDFKQVIKQVIKKKLKKKFFFFK